MTDLDSLLRAIVLDPHAAGRWLVLADYLEEHDDPRRAELLRLHRRLLASCCEPQTHPERAGWQARLIDLLGQGITPAGPERKLTLGEGVEMMFRFIPPGSFLMGSPLQEEGRHEEEVLHRVTLAKGFWLGAYPVTQAQWRWATGGNPSRFKDGDNLPVDRVSWDETQDFCLGLGNRTGERFRLPTEAEWEYTARSGTTTPFFWGETITPEQTNYDGNYVYGRGPTGVYREKTSSMGSFPANGWGLFDMHGNVWEWCQDWLGNYATTDQSDPVGNPKGDFRALRGGSWFDRPRLCRSAARFRFDPSIRFDNFGCRVVWCPDEKER